MLNVDESLSDTYYVDLESNCSHTTSRVSFGICWLFRSYKNLLPTPHAFLMPNEQFHPKKKKKIKITIFIDNLIWAHKDPRPSLCSIRPCISSLWIHFDWDQLFYFWACLSSPTFLWVFISTPLWVFPLLLHRISIVSIFFLRVENPKIGCSFGFGVHQCSFLPNTSLSHWTPWWCFPCHGPI